MAAREQLETANQATAQELAEAHKLVTERDLSMKTALEQLQHSNSRCDDALQRINEAEREHRAEMTALTEMHGEASRNFNLRSTQRGSTLLTRWRGGIRPERNLRARMPRWLFLPSRSKAYETHSIPARQKIETLEATLHKVLHRMGKLSGNKLR